MESYCNSAYSYQSRCNLYKISIVILRASKQIEDDEARISALAMSHPSSYPHPVLCRTVPDVTLERLVEQGDLSLTDKVIETARELEASGVTAITSDCGYMLHFEEQVAAAVCIPVMLSSLLQLPFMASLLGPGQAVGIICSNRRRLTDELLAKANPNARIRVHVVGLENCPTFVAPSWTRRTLSTAMRSRLKWLLQPKFSARLIQRLKRSYLSARTCRRVRMRFRARRAAGFRLSHAAARLR